MAPYEKETGNHWAFPEMEIVLKFLETFLLDISWTFALRGRILTPNGGNVSGNNCCLPGNGDIYWEI